ncbi:Mur ligase [Zychaea mexicana]|uniref:Mur ligase n=1 Tax=Zychaea mexicana TaxID=64656 RepID=UPI0022FE4B6F|nr:Mur ligase [Zychaea mexicana]KAI9495861.1 Mur ligase [Zychaea mexicana]
MLALRNLLAPRQQLRLRSYTAMAFTYEEAVEKIISTQTNAATLDQLRKLGPRMNDRSLPEMRAYFKRIGYEPSDFNKLNMIHVTGTKGKGSTSALTQSILKHYPSADKPIRTGLFTSPHLVAMRERIRINGEPISEELFAKYTQDVWERLENTKADTLAHIDTDDARQLLRMMREHPDKPAYFRMLNLVAMHAFMQENVDLAILEVGVGGEYDSTNIIENPIVCGITALGLDHVNVLGDTIDKIAWHKAGIIKPNTPVIAFEQVSEAMAVIEQRAQEKNAPLTILHAKDIEHLKDVKVGLAGVHQQYNALTAVELCRVWLERCRGVKLDEAVPEEFKAGLAKVVWPGRGQKLDVRDTQYSDKAKDVTYYLDGAHTAESLAVCANWFQETVKEQDNGESGSRILMFNCTNGRDGPRLLDVIAKIQPEVKFDHVIFTTNVTFRKGYTADTKNMTVTNADAVAMQKTLADAWKERQPSFGQDKVHVVPTIEDGVGWIADYSKTSPQKVQVLTTGSLIMVGNTLTALGVPAQ